MEDRNDEVELPEWGERVMDAFSNCSSYSHPPYFTVRDGWWEVLLPEWIRRKRAQAAIRNIARQTKDYLAAVAVKNAEEAWLFQSLSAAWAEIEANPWAVEEIWRRTVDAMTKRWVPCGDCSKCCSPGADG